MLEHVTVSMLAEGHILVEDYPGVGKTALARALSRSIDCAFARVQCTADLLPADIVGSQIYNQREGRFEFRPGPIFANVVIVDEVNRASPKTQSGLLECMQERNVTVDATSHELARPFLVFATQNPVEYEGTYPLPEAQVDRFMVRLSMGYPDAEAEAGMLAGHESRDRVLDLEPVATRAEIVDAVETAHRVHASRALRNYIVALLRRTRDDDRVELGASPRAGLMLLRAAKARALVHGRDHALPDDVQALAEAVLSHRLMLAPEAAGVQRSEIVADAIASVRALVRCARRSDAPRSACCCWSSRAHSTLSRSTSPAPRCSLLGAGARGVDRARRRRREARARDQRAVGGRGPAAAGQAAARRPGGCRCRPAGSTSRCCPSPCACPPGAARRGCGSRSPSAAAAAAGSRRPRSCCATRSASPSA